MSTLAPPTFDLAALIREHVEETPAGDIHDVTAAVLAGLAEEDVRFALATCLPRYVSDVIRQDRQRVFAHRPGPSKWDAVRGEEVDIFRAIVYPGGVAKRFGLCSRDEVLELVEDYQRRAAENTAQAGAYDRLASVMKKRRAKVVSDLPPDAVLEALHG